MELLYLYVFDDKRNIKGCEFNFSPGYRFSFNSTTKSLEMVEKAGLPSQWFGSNIDNIIAIIGKNGAGKSNLIDSIIKVLCGQGGGIAIWKHEGVLYRNKTSYEVNCNFEIHQWSFWGNPFSGDIKGAIKNTVVIYYSPTIDRNIEEKKNQYKAFRNISNSWFLRQKISADTSVPNYAQLPEVEYMQLIDTFRLILFFIYNREKKIELPASLRKPEYLRIGFHLFDNEEPDHPAYQALNKDRNNTFESQLKYFITRQIFKEIKVPDSWNENTTLDEMLSVYTNNGETDRPNIYNDLIQLHIEKKICCDLNKQKPSKIGDDFYLSIRTDALSIKFLTALWGYYFRREPYYASFGTLTFLQSIRNDSLTVKWDGMSSGESAFYNFMSRLYGTLYQMEDEIYHAAQNKIVLRYQPEIETVILILDEAELSFHPEWQQKFINLLIDSLQRIFYNIHFQIILASHSPILISDLPKSNIIFLSRDENGNCKVCNPMCQKETFGANIHTLFNDSFFLDGLPIGDFAKKKIQHLFDRILINKEAGSEILSEINLVGEIVLKNQLKKLYDENIASLSIDEQIDAYKEKIEFLKQLKNDTDY